jgi:ABC-type sugar transport system ATPase subunit
MESGQTIMEARKVTQVYPGTVALKEVNFNVYQGKVNILIGENGAGKSTLMRILAGIEQPTSGTVLLDGQEVKILGPKDAAKKGIGIIHQELNLYPDLTVLQNIFMGQEHTKGKGLVLNNKEHVQKTREVLQRLEHDIDPKQRVGDLRMGQQQIIEIAKSLLNENMKVLIMDEPTSSLSNAEVNILFKVINDLKNSGISIIYISHRMEEIMRIGDHVTILRDGYLVAESEVKDIDISWIVSNMIGKEKSTIHAENKSRSTGEEILRVVDLTLPSESGNNVLDHVSFHLDKGEILGVYGLLGSGRTEMLECLMGMRLAMTGEIYLEGQQIKPKVIAEQIKRGFYLIPEDRKSNGLIHSLNIQKNITLSSLKKYTKLGSINKKKESDATLDTIRRLSIKVADAKLPIFSLSGGNQQKVVIGKGILTEPKILLLDEPTRGIDVGAKEEVFKLIYEFAKEGYSVIVVASELGEILRVSDRIIVLSEGKLAGELSREEANESKLVEYSEIEIKKHVAEMGEGYQC